MTAAATLGHVDVARELLDAGANVNGANKDKVTALHFAVARRCLEMVVILLRAGADLSLKDSNGQTAQAYAGHQKDPTVADAIMAHVENAGLSDSVSQAACVRKMNAWI